MPPEPPPAMRPSSGHQNLSFDPQLRIPPLQHPLPIVATHRPPPLEPNACVHEPPHHPTAKLTSRSKALDEAKLIGEDDDLAPFHSRRSDPRHGASPAERDEGMRKKQKVDIFQLPKPQSKPRDNKPPPFEPIRILNELHEPPPSAGLFPPITPNSLRDIEPSASRSDPASSPVQETKTAKPSPPPQESSSKKSKASPSSSSSEVKPKAKRKCLRGRLKWTDAETQDLLKGVSLYGVGKWKKILTHPAFSFHPDRTMVDLKDRYRTCRMNEEKAIERKAAEEGASTAMVGPWADAADSLPLYKTRRESDTIRKALKAAEPLFNITTSTSYEESLHSPKQPRKAGGANPWTSEEDVNLSRGYQKYGFQWTAIAKDPEFGLGHRTGAQVRDRFRMKYPIIYQSSVPLPLPDSTKRGGKKKSRSASDSKDRLPPTLTFIMHDTEKPPLQSIPKKERIRPSLPAIHPPAEQSVPSLSSQGSSPGTPAVMLPDRFSGLNVQPLPEPEQEVEDRPEASTSHAASSQAGSSPEGDNEPEHTAADAEEVRHLSILGLLNDDTDTRGRLPSFKYALDDWDGPGEGSVTLPPLLSWEEMSNKPVFDLE